MNNCITLQLKILLAMVSRGVYFKPNVIRLTTYVNDEQTMNLINPWNSHNFLSSGMVNRCGLHTLEVKTITIMLLDGSVGSTSSKML
jgi:hypothetical protein